MIYLSINESNSDYHQPPHPLPSPKNKTKEKIPEKPHHLAFLFQEAQNPFFNPMHSNKGSLCQIRKYVFILYQLYNLSVF